MLKCFQKSSGGNLHKAIYKHFNNEKSQEFLAQFIQWMRLCYSKIFQTP